MPKDQQPEFTVTDRRKFTIDGDTRPDVSAEVPEERAAEPIAAAPVPPAPEPPKAEPPQTAPAEPVFGDTGYNAASAQSQFGGQTIEFMHIVDLMVQTAMMYAGAMESGPERRVDIVGLRQMIDMMGVLQEKTKGNLTDQENAVLSNTLFQLRMTYMEIVNMIQQQAAQGPAGTPKA
jgi:hypothetical protein